MKMKMKAEYVCELCETSYPTLEECQFCEEGHITKFQTPDYDYKPMYEDRVNRFPSGILLITEDGKEEAYFKLVTVKNKKGEIHHR